MHTLTRRVVAMALALGVSMPVLAQHGRPALYYQITSISPKPFTIFQGGGNSEARDINNLGEIVGWATTAGGDVHAFKRALLGATVDIGAGDIWHDTFAEAINDLSEVVGYGPGFGGHIRGFHWSPASGFHVMSSSNPEGVETWRDYYPAAINNLGRIVGYTTLSNNTAKVAVAWSHHTADPSLVHFPPAGIDSLATDVTDGGGYTGAEYDPTNGNDRVFRYYLGVPTYPADPFANAKDQRLHALNEAGTAVGSAKNANWEHQRAVRWRRTGSPLVLGVLPGGDSSEALDINEQEFIVGKAMKPLSPGSSAMSERAFLYHHDFGMIELPPPNLGFDYCGANALNDRKDNGLVQVAGYCGSWNTFQAVRWDVFVGEHP